MNKKTIRLGVAVALTALSLAALAVPAQADTCGPVIDSVEICTTYDGSRSYPVLVSSAVSGPRPGIDGALVVGNTLTVYDGSWDPVDATLTHQWLRNGIPISEATASTYKVRTADRGNKITVRVTGSRLGYTTVSRTSGARIAQ